MTSVIIGFTIAAAILFLVVKYRQKHFDQVYTTPEPPSDIKQETIDALGHYIILGKDDDGQTRAVVQCTVEELCEYFLALDNIIGKVYQKGDEAQKAQIDKLILPYMQTIHDYMKEKKVKELTGSTEPLNKNIKNYVDLLN